MSNYTKIRDIIRRMSGQENVFTVPKIYVEFTGDITTAILLNQIVFLSDKSKRTDGFFYKTYDEWYEEICLTKRQVSYSVKKLKELGLVETKLKRANGAPTVHYKLDYDKLLDSIVTKCHYPSEQNVTNHCDKMSQTLTESTTENTTEIKDILSDSGNQTTIPYEEIVDYLNEKASTRYRATTQKTKSLIKARWNEGFTLDDFKRVIDNKSSQWINSDMQKYLRPETLFGTKFEGYLNEFVATKKQSIPVTNHPEGIDW